MSGIIKISFNKYLYSKVAINNLLKKIERWW